MHRQYIKWLSSAVALIFSFQANGFEHFITRSGHQLFDGQQVFRFVGIHAPELHRIENDAKGKCPQDPRGWGQFFQWPTADEQENWIKALSKTGHKAMRIYVLSVAHPADKACSRQTHILPPTTSGGMPSLNEQAMLVYDRLIMLAEKHQLRLILPFIDHWEWWGGRKQLAAFYGENEDQFYDVNSKTFAAYLDIVSQVISRTNTLTGKLYSEEKAIMAWETGNELKGTNARFLNQAVTHIKTLAPKQLIVDGNYLELNEHGINHPDVDIISNHFYTVNDNNKPQTIKDDLAKIAGRKAYLVGEFGLIDIQLMSEIMDTAVNFDYQGAKAIGAFIWGFRGHRHNGGFYYHKEYTGHYSYRIPGFAEAEFNQESAVVDLVRNSIAKLQGLQEMLPLPVPESPKLRPISTIQNITWMGAPVGRSYRIERSTAKQGPWTVIADNISDGQIPFDPDKDRLFTDNNRFSAGTLYYYRVIAKNESGESAPSNIQSFLYTSN